MHRRAIKNKRSKGYRSEDDRDIGLSVIFKWLREVRSSRVVLCAAAIILMTLAFVVTYRVSLMRVFFAIPLGFLTGYAMSFVERRILSLHNEAMKRYGRIQAGFLAFFVFLLIGILAFLVMLIYPMRVFADYMGEAHLTVHYGRWMINLGIIISLVCWLRCVIRRLGGPTG